MRCLECKGILFVFDEEIQTEKIQQERIKRYLKNMYMEGLDKNEKEKLMANLEDAGYRYKDGIIEIYNKEGVIGNLYLKAEIKIDKRYKCEIGSDPFIYPLGKAKFEDNKTKIYFEKNENKYFVLEDFPDDKKAQETIQEILKKNLNKNIVNKSALMNDLKDAKIYNEDFEIIARKENKMIFSIYLKSFFSLNNKEKEWTIGFVEKLNNKIQVFYESGFFDFNNGEIVCLNCGAVIESNVIDTTPEWRSFDNAEKEKKSRASGAIRDAKVSKGLTTEIDRYDRDAKGGGFEAERKVELYRIRKLQVRSRMSDSVNRNLSIALPELDRMCSLLNLGETIKEDCAYLYRQAVEKGFVKGRSIESIIGAIICYVTRAKEQPRTLEEISEKSGISKKEIGRSYKHILKSMNLKSPKINVEDYILLCASKLGIPNVAEKEAQKIFMEAKKYGIAAGRGPSGIAAAVISLACEKLGINFPKKELLEMAGITLSTLHNREEEIKKKLKM